MRPSQVLSLLEREFLAAGDALLYFTDAQGEFPDTVPDYPVLWLVKGSSPVPFGERAQLSRS